MLVLVTIACLFMGLVGKDIWRSRAEQKVVDRLTSMGNATISYDYQLTQHGTLSSFMADQPPGNRLLRSWFGDHLYSRVIQVSFRVRRVDINPQVQLLPKLGDLRDVRLDWTLLDDESVEALSQVPRLRRITLHHTEILPHQFQILGQSKSLDQVTLSATAANDFNLRYVAEMPKVSRIHLNIASVTDKGLRPLAGMNQLEELVLDHAIFVSDDGLASLSDLSEMKVFHAYVTELTDGSLQTISKWDKLESLTINPKKGLETFRDPGCGHLPKLKHLQYLDLSGTKICDRAIPSICKLTELRTLRLDNTEITDAGLKQLQKLPHLESLSIAGTLVTDSGLDLLEAFPSLAQVVLSDQHLTNRERIGDAEIMHVPGENVIPVQGF